MKAWLLNGFTGLGALAPGAIPDPVPGPGEALLQIHYAALNPADRYLAEGQYPAQPPLPHILGRDGIGTVFAIHPAAAESVAAATSGIGSTVSIRVGDKCAVLRGETGISRPGTFAERVVVALDSLVPIPPGWDDREAAGATLVYLTAYQALTQWGELRSSSSAHASPAQSAALAPVILVTGASGGVGVATVQLAVAMGYTVIVLSRSPEKARRLRELGAAASFDPTRADWPKELKASMPGRRVDLAVDNIGGALFSQVIETLGDHAKVSVVGRLAGPVPQFNTASLFFRRLRIGGVAVGTFSRGESHAAWNNILTLLGKAGSKPLVDRVFPFDDLPAAFARLAEGPLGKVLLQVKGPG